MKIVYILMKGKRGWMRILEATIAVLVVSGVMLAVYSGEPKDDISGFREHSQSVEKEIIDDMVLDPDLRLDILRVKDDVPGDPAYDNLDEFVKERIPDSFGYLLRVCKLGNLTDFCKMNSEMFIATVDKDVFVEENVVSSELGDGTDATYSPKKVRLFFWEGGIPEGFCSQECSTKGYSLGCSADLMHVVNKSCGNFDNDACLEYNDSFEYSVESCNSTSLCIGGICVTSPYSKSNCEKKTYTKSGCVWNFDDECNNYDEGKRTGGCGFLGFKDKYKCWNIDKYTTACELNPVCDDGYFKIGAVPCAGSVTS